MNIANSFIQYILLIAFILVLTTTHEATAQEVKPIKEELLLQELENQQKIDSLLSTIDTVRTVNLSQDSLQLSDSINKANKALLDSLNAASPKVPPLNNTKKALEGEWRPNPTKATWYAIVFPGGGQIYNRKYWKLPIFYGGFTGCAYALSWNNTMYKDYSQAYRDLKDNNPNTNSYLDLLPPNSSIDPARLETLLKNRKDRFRRYRDLSIIAFIGVYALSIIDAYVDAELSNFDISPDLSLRIEPAIIQSTNSFTKHESKSVGLQCKFTF